MNYIHRLQAGFTQAHDRIAAIDTEIRAFRLHLAGDKFCGYEPDGSRRDWIATADVHRWLDRIASAARHGEPDGAPAMTDRR
jgi:hypothetical protein